MSVAKLLLSGLLIASGLILGAFTLHAHFAPPWQGHAAARLKPQQPVRAQQASTPDNWAPRLIKADPKPQAKPSSEAAAAKASKGTAEKRSAEKRQKAEKARKEEPEKKEEPQTVLSWLASLLNN